MRSSSSIAAFLAITIGAPAFFFTAQGNAQEQGVVRLPPEAVQHLPGVARLFSLPAASQAPEIREHNYIPGEVVARFNLELSDAEILQLARAAGADQIQRLSPIGLFLLQVEPREMGDVMDRLWRTEAAIDIGPNYVGELTYSPNDPHHASGAQWYHEASSDIDLDLTAAWDITRGSSEVIVAVVDTGVDVDHPEFVGRYYVNPLEIPGNQLDDDNNGYVDDVSGWNAVDVNGNVNDTTLGHGTWVASILLANSDNSHQIAGFDHNVRLLPLKALDGQFGTEANLMAALDYLVLNPGIAQIVNMSLANYDDNHTGLENSLSAVALDSVLIGGSGNNGPNQADVGYPESHPDVITISGTDQNDDLAFFPTAGTTAATGTSVDFSAPALDIYTASWASPNNPNAAQVGPGTSFATPMVSGIATLALSVWPTMTKVDLIEILKASAVDLGAPGKDIEFGWGRVNAHQALLAIPYIFADGFESGDLLQWSSSVP